MANSRRNQDSDITRIIGILFLEVLAAIVLFNLAGIAQQQRTGMDRPIRTEESKVVSVKPFDLGTEKSLPKVAIGRYNKRW